MRKIVIGGMTAALALSLTACNFNADDKPAAASPSSPAASAPAPSQTPSSGATSPGNGSNGDSGNGSDGSDGSGDSSTPRPQHSPPSQGGGQQITSKWGRLRYVAPGKFSVGGVVFFTATDTSLTIAGGTCPDGTPPNAENSKCGIDGIDEWAQRAPHNVNVHFSGQTATSIMETQ
ncbi:hypothetical protein J4573_47605 [Actinomadura barringtoniae]|uniref:Uncharacterized protein n=1 Tax=Actinomadura barringtoniae TaxID=1427535 RepID=A0A939PL68_9ACTN|nr:hypothetical protein [Actinomadura barringtoniae]MBO2454826.1 hypothetical protein [Actinomadura barringtoniae]